MNEPTYRTRVVTSLARACSVVGLLALYACSDSAIVEDEPPASHAEPGMAFFHGSFDDAVAEAREQGKKVFLDVYTDWCGPCIVMQETVFPLPEVGEYFNARFVNYKLDAEDESIGGPEIAARYEVKAYPTYLILDNKGAEIGRATSGMSGDQFVALFSRMLGETESQFETIKARFDSGERSPEFVQEYLDAAIVDQSMGSDFDFQRFAELKKVAGDYFASRDHSVLVNETDARLIATYWDKTPRGDSLVEFVIDNYDEFVSVSSDAAMSQFVLGATWYAGLAAAELGDGSYEALLEELGEEPLSKAVAYDLARDPASVLDPVRMHSVFQMRDLVASENWGGVASEWARRIADAGATADARTYNGAARDLAGSPEAAHQALALEYYSKAYELDSSDALVAASYGAQLRRAGQDELAEQLMEEFRASLGDSAEDQRQLELFNRLNPQTSD
ncbi:MAG: thioredoxin family protein [Gammaproteobacteria bacterium]|nr:thioredoxin family protein [Gammaproteobacteria bacterium]